VIAVHEKLYQRLSEFNSTRITWPERKKLQAASRKLQATSDKRLDIAAGIL